MNENKAIEIEYIEEKLKKSTIITVEDNISIVDTQDNIKDIKQHIMDILACTNIKDKIKENNEGRHIYKLKEDVSKHILGVISNKYSKDEKKEIIKQEVKKITENQSVVLINRGNIYITDTGKKERVIEVKKQKKIETRYNGYQGDELETLVKEYLGNEENTKKIIISIIQNINYKNLNINQITSILTLGYKSFLLSSITEGIEKKFDLEKEVAKAIGGKILRDNFTYSTILLFENIYNNLLINKLDSEEINKMSIDYIIENYFNFNKNDIYKNLLNLNNIFNTETQDTINVFLNKIYIFDGNINNIALKTIQQKKGIILDKNILENIIDQILEKLIKTFKTNTSKLPNPTIDFMKDLGKISDQIKISYIKTPVDIIRLSGNLKLLINQEIKLEKNIELKNKHINDYKKSIQQVENGLKGIELTYKSNQNDINKYLLNIGFKSLQNTELILNQLLEESKKTHEKISEIEKNVKKLSSNKLKETINTNKINKLQKELNIYKRKFRNIENIIKLEKENLKIKNKLKEYYSTIKKIQNTKLSIKTLEDELNIILDKIYQIQIGLKNMILNHIK